MLMVTCSLVRPGAIRAGHAMRMQSAFQQISFLPVNGQVSANRSPPSLVKMTIVFLLCR
jgi:hypothetical protein